MEIARSIDDGPNRRKYPSGGQRTIRKNDGEAWVGTKVPLGKPDKQQERRWGNMGKRLTKVEVDSTDRESTALSDPDDEDFLSRQCTLLVASEI